MAQRRRSARRQSVRSESVEQAGAPPPRRRRPNQGARKIPRAVFVIGSVFLIAIVTLVVTNYWFSVKRPGDEPFLQVNSRVFTWTDYVGMLRFQKLGTETLGGRFDAGREPYVLIQSMAENELVRQAALREGLRVSDEEIRQEMIQRLVDKPEELGGANQIDREFTVRLNNYLTAVQFSKGDYKELVEVALLRSQLRDKLGDTSLIPRVQPHVFLHLIQGDDPQSSSQTDNVGQIERLLADDEDFATVARRLSIDESGVDGGEIGWVPRLVFQDFDTELFGLREGQVSQPLRTDDGVYLVKLIERVNDRGRLEVILVEDLRTAREVENLFDSGISFSELSTRFSIDPELQANAGDLGLVAPGDHDGLFDKFIRGIALGESFGPVSSTGGTFFLMVTERTPAREIVENSLAVLKSRALDDWLRREWDQNIVNYCPGGQGNCFGSVKVTRALGEINDLSQTKVQANATATSQAADRAAGQG